MGDRVEPPEHRPATADGVAPEDQAELDSVVKGDAPLIDPDPKEVTDLLDEVEEQKREYDASFLDPLRDRLDSLEQEVELAKQMPRPDEPIVKPLIVPDDPGPHWDADNYIEYQGGNSVYVIYINGIQQCIHPVNNFCTIVRWDQRGQAVLFFDTFDTTWHHWPSGDLL